MAFDELVGQPSVVHGLASGRRQRPCRPRLSLCGPARDGQDLGRAHPGQVSQLSDATGRGPTRAAECEACVSIADGTAFDVVEIDAASNRGINEIRELRERVKLRARAVPVQRSTSSTKCTCSRPRRSTRCSRRSRSRREHVVFVLATTEPHKVPPTILSRCQRYDFRRMSPDDIGGRLAEVAEREEASKIVRKHVAAPRVPRRRRAARCARLARPGARFRERRHRHEAVLDAAFGASRLRSRRAHVGCRRSRRRWVRMAAVADAVDRRRGSRLARERAACAGSVWRCSRSRVRQSRGRGAARDGSTDQRAKATSIPRRCILAALRNLSETSRNVTPPQPRIDLELALIRVILPTDELSLQTLSDRLRSLEERAGTAVRSAGPADDGPKPPSASSETGQAHKPATAVGRRPAHRRARPPRRPPPIRTTVGQRSSATSEPLSLSKLDALWPMSSAP